MHSKHHTLIKLVLKDLHSDKKHITNTNPACGSYHLIPELPLGYKGIKTAADSFRGKIPPQITAGLT